MMNCNSIKKGFDSKPVYNKKYLKTNLKSDEGKISTDFNDDGIPKKGSFCICLSVIFIDSVFKVGKIYFPQVFSEECKYIFKEKKVNNYICDVLEISSDDFDKECFNV